MRDICLSFLLSYKSNQGEFVHKYISIKANNSLYERNGCFE